MSDRNKNNEASSSINENMKTRKFKMGGFSLIASVLCVAAAIALNFGLSRFPVSVMQFDITRGQVFEISEMTKEIAAKLDEEVTIYWLVSEGNEDTNLSHLLDRYDELITGTIPELEESIQEAIDKQIEIQIKEFDMAIDLHLDLAEAEKEWIDFRRRIIDGIKDDDILGLAQANFDQLDKYFGGGLLEDETSHLLEIIDEINIMKNGGKSNIFGDNMQTALDELEKYYKQSMTDLEELQDTIEEIEESFIDMMDKVADEMSKQNDLYSMLSDTLDHDMEVIKLAYGDTSYQELESYFAQKEENLRNQLDFQRQQVELWQQQMDTLEKGSEAWEVAKENWMDAVSEWQSNVEAAIENIQEKYANAIQAIFKELNNTLTKGAGLDYINQEWELITKNSEEYLDTVNREYQLQKLQAKYLESIDDTDNIAAKRKLNDLRQDLLSNYGKDLSGKSRRDYLSNLRKYENMTGSSFTAKDVLRDAQEKEAMNRIGIDSSFIDDKFGK